MKTFHIGICTLILNIAPLASKSDAQDDKVISNEPSSGQEKVAVISSMQKDSAAGGALWRS
jgi:hypothetical protein